MNPKNEAMDVVESPESTQVPEQDKVEAVATVVEESQGDEEQEEEEKSEKLFKFPLGRVKTIMKMDPEMSMASQESVFLISKATELFIESLAVECYAYTSMNKKKTVQKSDLDTAIDAVDSLAFLEGALDD